MNKVQTLEVEEMSIEEALQKADIYDKNFKNVASVSRTLAKEVRRLQLQEILREEINYFVSGMKPY